MKQITILKGTPKVVEGVSAKTGKPYKMVQQAALLVNADGTLEAFTSQGNRTKNGTVPYEPGSYTLADDSVYVRNGDLAFAPKLVPVAASREGAK